MKAAGRQHGFSRLGLIAIIGVIGMLALLVIPALLSAKRLSNQIACQNQLKNVGLSFRIFAADRTNAFPFQINTNNGGTRKWRDDPAQAWRHFGAISRELSIPRLLKCPSDRERIPARDWAQFTNNSYLSYFIGITASADNPLSMLAGDRNLILADRPLGSEVVTIQTNAIVGFGPRIHRSYGNTLFGNGSVVPTSSSRLQDLFRAAAQVTTNTLVIP